MRRRKKLHIGIIGSGGIAQACHMPAYRALEDVEILAVADVDPKTAQKAAKQFSVKHVFDDYRDLVAMDEIDAVSVCTPNAFHKDPTVAALGAGKHVLVEKPIAVNAREGEEMLKAAQAAGKILQVGLNNRFAANTQALKRAVDAGALGEIYFAEAVATRRRGIPGWGAFTQKSKSGGGALVDIGVHILDLTLYLMGFPKPVAVSGVTAAKFGPRKDLSATAGGWRWDPTKFDVDDFGVGLVRFECGATLTLKASWAGHIGDAAFNSTIWGTEGGCKWDPATIYREENGSLVDCVLTELPKVASHAEEVRLFVEAIREDKPSPVPAEEALVTQRILDAIYESGVTGKEVRL